MGTRRHHAQRWGAIALPVALGLASCTGDSGDAARGAAPPSRGRQLAISDQLHNNGTTGFVFLPPMVPRPAYFGDFLPDLEPVVRIDELGPTGATVRTLATFTRDSGPGRERIRVHRQGEPCDRDDDDGDSDPNGYFYARWFTNHERLSTAAVYRVRVFVQERVHPCTRNGWGRRCRHGEDNTAPMREIGYADVDVVRNAPEMRAVDRTEFVPLINGHTLRIKFRIDRPVVDADGDGVYNWRDNCRTTANASQLDTDRDGEGDACECAGVTCAPTDACHAAGTCSPTNGMCSNPAAPDGSACPLTNAAGLCAAGVCGAPTCSAGFGNCDGNAANGCEQQTNTTAHCGGCNVACTSGAHSTATCATGTCGLVCAAGWFDADGDRANGCELDITTDANCGAPGNACVSGTGGTTTCASGACSTMACPSGRANCNTAIGDGCEVTLGTDVSNCGACGHACAVPNATAACRASQCAVGDCVTGFADVNGNPADGCEVNLATDSTNCGAAGNVCPAPANGTAACLSGTCGIGSCASGFADVNGVAADGCEVSFATSPSHCGGLNNACSAPNGTAGCAAGQCTLAACNAGFASCDGSATNGCETVTSSDVSNCGACGAACPSGANSAPTCTSGACGIACAAGFADVNGNAADGCEVNLATDPSHCGRVGVACTQGRTCQAGVCTSTTCVSGLANCDGQEATGCEVTLATDPSHCGACGRACAFPNARPDCMAGACTFTVCDLGFADVDGNRANGCEVNLATDVSHCGAPGNACSVANGTAACAAGACAVSACSAGFANCDGAAANGCEAALATNVNHCGACGNACPTPANATRTCAAGACGFACAAGFSNCDGNAANGCETAGPVCTRTTWVRTGLVNIGTGDRGPADVATDAAGNVYVLHRYFQSATVDGAAYSSPGGAAILTSRTTTGALRWAARFDGLGGHMMMQRVAVDPASGDVYVAGGGWGNTFRVNGVEYGDISRGRWTAARLRAADGSVVWARSFRSSNDTLNDRFNDGFATALAVGPTGELYLGGSYQGQVNIDGHDLGPSTAGRAYEAYVARVNPATSVVEALHRYGGNNTAVDQINAIVPLPGGDYIAAGQYTEGGSITLGGVTSPTAAASGEAAFWFRASSTGVVQWARFSNTSREKVLDARLGPTGSVYLSGLCEGNMTFGGMPVTTSGTAFLARVDPSTGAPLWVDTNSEWTEWFGMPRFVVDASDVVHATWWSRGGNASSTFGGVNLGITGGGWQSFVVLVAGATGAVTRVERFASSNTWIQSRAIALSGGRHVLAGFYFPLDGSPAVEGFPWTNHLLAGQHLDAFTLYLNF